MDFGGIRLEDVVVITDSGEPPENLVSPALPRSAAGIEALMAAGAASSRELGNEFASVAERAGRPHAAPNSGRFAGDSVIR